MGLLDFAGGTVVHINAGIAGIVAALVLGARRGYPHENLSPHDLTLAVVGTALLWVGWFGFNGGSPGLLEGNAGQFYIQLIGIAATIVWSGVVTWILLKVIGAILRLRVSDEAERIGLDITQHGEAVQ